MKIDANVDDIQGATLVLPASNQTVTANYQIKSSAFAFQTIFANLYSDPVSSVFREIVANAVDANTAANDKSRAVVITFPTHSEPVFSVRDYGVGMTHDFVMNQFSTAFHSEKTDTNEQTGMFGLGSKSPFSISKQFTVTARDGTERRVYSCYICDVDGFPKTTLITTVPDKTAGGIEISVPVKADHITEFKELVNDDETTFVLHDKTVVFANTTRLRTPLDEMYVRRENDVYTGMAPAGYGSLKLYVRQGMACYPVDTDKLNSTYNATYKRLNSMWLYYGKCSLFLDMPIGSLAITPSREALIYTDKTMENICDVINVQYDLLKANFDKCYAGHEPGTREAVEALVKYYSGQTYGLYKDNVNIFTQGRVWEDYLQKFELSGIVSERENGNTGPAGDAYYCLFVDGKMTRIVKGVSARNYYSHYNNYVNFVAIIGNTQLTTENFMATLRENGLPELNDTTGECEVIVRFVRFPAKQWEGAREQLDAKNIFRNIYTTNELPAFNNIVKVAPAKPRKAEGKIYGKDVYNFKSNLAMHPVDEFTHYVVYNSVEKKFTDQPKCVCKIKPDPAHPDLQVADIPNTPAQITEINYYSCEVFLKQLQKHFGWKIILVPTSVDAKKANLKNIWDELGQRIADFYNKPEAIYLADGYGDRTDKVNRLAFYSRVLANIPDEGMWNTFVKLKTALKLEYESELAYPSNAPEMELIDYVRYHKTEKRIDLNQFAALIFLDLDHVTADCHETYIEGLTLYITSVYNQSKNVDDADDLD